MNHIDTSLTHSPHRNPKIHTRPYMEHSQRTQPFYPTTIHTHVHYCDVHLLTFSPCTRNRVKLCHSESHNLLHTSQESYTSRYFPVSVTTTSLYTDSFRCILSRKRIPVSVKDLKHIVLPQLCIRYTPLHFMNTLSTHLLTPTLTDTRPYSHPSTWMYYDDLLPFLPTFHFYT